MNKAERKHLQEIRDQLSGMQEVEQEKYDNAPENLQDSERYELIQEVADNLQEAIDILDQILDG